MTRRELQSLKGLLQHATAVVRPGRAFLQRLYGLQHVGSEPSHNIRLNTVARADIIWWELFISRWNGISMLVNPKQDVADTTVASDALGNWGGGGGGQGHYAYCPGSTLNGRRHYAHYLSRTKS